MHKLTRDDYENRMLRLQLYIQRHLDGDLELKKLAKIAAFSPYHCHRIFRSLVGESVQSYIRRLRLEATGTRLLQSDVAVTEIAREAGYDNLESFIRAFRERFQIAPGQYRKQRRGRPPAARQLVLQIQCKGTSIMKLQVKMENLPSMKVAFARHIGPYQNCCRAWEKLCGDPEVQKRIGPNTLILGISYDDPDVTDADKLRYDAAVTVADDAFTPGPGIGFQTIAGGRYAVIRHVGSYSGLAEVYRQIFGEWLPDSGQGLRDAPPLEIYRNCPDSTPEAELITDICIPLK
jgi:AraC family transcriptional regulator